MFSRIFNLQSFISGLLPLTTLSLIVTFPNFSLLNASSWQELFSKVDISFWFSCILFLITFVVTIFFVRKLSLAMALSNQHSCTISNIKRENPISIEYLFMYLVPVLFNGIDGWRYVILIGVLLTLIGWSYINYHMFVLNPILDFCGYKYYRGTISIYTPAKKVIYNDVLLLSRTPLYFFGKNDLLCTKIDAYTFYISSIEERDK